MSFLHSAGSQLHTIPQAQFTQFLQTAAIAGFSLLDIRIFGCHKING